MPSLGDSLLLVERQDGVIGWLNRSPLPHRRMVSCDKATNRCIPSSNNWQMAPYVLFFGGSQD